MLLRPAGRSIELRLLHPEKALLPMLLRPAGRLMELRLLHPEKV
jgi:hypothetical protein